MRGPVVFALGAASALAGAFACTDLFHSTADVLDKCEIDAASCPLDFCTLPSQTAEEDAEHACAWLGACESPLGRNAFGPCMIEARLAFDCNLNPNHQVIHETHDLWQCLASVRSCGEVRRCLLPSDATLCAGATGSTGCVSAGTGSVRVACSDGGALIENCALWGETCGAETSPAACGPGPGGGLTCGEGGAPGSCVGGTGRIYWCGAAGEVGIDCTATGAGQCNGYPSRTDAAWVACVPEADAACPAGLSVSCANGVATSCPTGKTETIDCARLLGTIDSCSDADLSPPFDWTSPCSGGDTCQDSCDAGALAGCARGAQFRTDCASLGLGNCRMVNTDVDDAGPRAACSPPALE